MQQRTTAPTRFNIIYADPPWQFKSWRADSEDRLLSAGGRRLPYRPLSTEDIAALPVQQIVAKDAVLFLWAIYPMLPDALAVIRAWGFTFRTVAFTWTKLNPSGIGWHFGMGFWTRANPEICLLATRGRPARRSRAVPNLVVSPRRDHSRKPEEVRNRIIELCGDLPRIELFAREKPPGWAVWGDEVSSDIELSLNEEIPAEATVDSGRN